MTVIAACKDGLRVCIGADSRETNGGSVHVAHKPKLFRIGPVIWGSTGDLALQSLVRRFELEWERPNDSESLRQWLDRYFVAALRCRAVEAGIIESRDGCQYVPGMLLMALGSEAFCVESLGGLLEVDDFWAIGSGGAEARGAMHACRMQEHYQADLAVRAGLAAAGDLNNGCGPPYGIEWTEPR